MGPRHYARTVHTVPTVPPNPEHQPVRPVLADLAALLLIVAGAFAVIVAAWSQSDVVGAIATGTLAIIAGVAIGTRSSTR